MNIHLELAFRQSCGPRRRRDLTSETIHQASCNSQRGGSLRSQSSNISYIAVRTCEVLEIDIVIGSEGAEQTWLRSYPHDHTLMPHHRPSHVILDDQPASDC